MEELSTWAPRAELPEGQPEVTGRQNWGRRQRREAAGKAVAVIARPRADSPEDQREAAGGGNRLQQPARGTVCEAAVSPARLQEDLPKDQHEGAGGRNLQRRRALVRLISLGQSAEQ